jgi:type II secretory pathway predicted ATPase ExeA
MTSFKGNADDRESQPEHDRRRPAALGVFVRSGDYWTVGFDNTKFTLKDIKGFYYIDRLLRHPGEEFHVLDLVSESVADPNSQIDVPRDPTLSISRLGDSGEILDVRAKQDYKRRLSELREEFEELRRCGAHERAAKVESEIEFLEREIAYAMGLGGRNRRAGSAAERARLNVTRLIRTAIQRISEHNRALGESFDRSIKTGTFCSYFPDPRMPIMWQFSIGQAAPTDEVGGDGRSTALVSQISFLEGVASIVVGRESELNRMRGLYEQALAGQRRVVFVAGEAGIGKTTFVRAFLDSVNADRTRIMLGQCIERYGMGEPYMPVLEALTRLCNGADRERVVQVLWQFAPSWVIQIPWLLSSDEQRLDATTQGVTQQRMLREITQAVEALAADRPLVLTLDDLHWSDFSTLDLISAIARRTEHARLLIIGTYRPVEILRGDHPLHAIEAELQLHRYCEGLRLKPLNEGDVATYLKRRLADNEAYESLARKAPAIYQRTEGNPLFMVNVVDYLLEEAPHIDEVAIETPYNIFQMIERNIERLDEREQRVLEAASVAGAEFSATAVAAHLEAR